MQQYVTREDGWILLKHRTPHPVTVIIEADSQTYNFSTTNPNREIRNSNLSMAWVDPKHAGRLLQEQARICCGKKGNKFLPANELDLSLWMTGGRP